MTIANILEQNNKTGKVSTWLKPKEKKATKKKLFTMDSPTWQAIQYLESLKKSNRFFVSFKETKVSGLARNGVILFAILAGWEPKKTYSETEYTSFQSQYGLVLEWAEKLK